MNEKLSQFAGLFGTVITVACCLGIPVILSEDR